MRCLLSDTRGHDIDLLLSLCSLRVGRQVRCNKDDKPLEDIKILNIVPVETVED